MIVTKRLYLSAVALLLICASVTPFSIARTQQNTPAGNSQRTPAHKPYTSKSSPAALAYADAELRRMTLDEKIGQLISIGVNASYLPQDSEAFKNLRRQIEENHVGGIILFRGGVYDSAHLVNRMQRFAKRPLLISADLEAGAGMRFDDTVNLPWNMAIAASGDPELARRAGLATARESRAIGVHQVFAPVVDVNNNSENPVINVRSYGEDPADVARFGAAFVEGLQQGGVIATAKHFPGHGDTSVDSHRGLPLIDLTRERLDRVELVPFNATIRAGVGSIMPSHIAIPTLDSTQIKPLPRAQVIRPVYSGEEGEVLTDAGTMPATLSPRILTDLLRGDMKFDGLIVTDAMDMSGLTIYFDQATAAVRSIKAGADVLLKPADADAMIRGLREAVRTGELTEARIDQSARRVLAAKFDLGAVENRFTSLDAIDKVVSDRGVNALADEIAARALTLVRDDARLLPATIKPDARVFNLAITNGDDRNFVANTFAGTARRMNVPMDTVVLDERSTDQDVEAAIRRASEASLVVASLYGRVRTGQARSVGLPDPGARALNALVERKSPVVAISFGNPYLLSSFPNLRTYLVAYGDMPSLQRAAARAVFGGAGVSGKLPISLPGLYARGTGLTLAPRQNAASQQGIDAANTTGAPRNVRDGIGEGRPR